MNKPSRLGRPRNPAADAAILDAAALRLSRDGYERMTIDDVARDAGVTRPTVYRRWGSKDELVIAAVARQIHTSYHEPSGDPRQDLLEQAQSLISRWSHNRYVGLLGAAIVERRHHPAIYDRLLEVLVRPRREQLRAILRAAIRDGRARADIDVEVIVAMFVGSFYAVTVADAWSESESAAWAERLTGTVMALIADPEPAGAGNGGSARATTEQNALDAQPHEKE